MALCFAFGSSTQMPSEGGRVALNYENPFGSCNQENSHRKGWLLDRSECLLLALRMVSMSRPEHKANMKPLEGVQLGSNQTPSQTRCLPLKERPLQAGVAFPIGIGGWGAFFLTSPGFWLTLVPGWHYGQSFTLRLWLFPLRRILH